jgi:hypothetical protein
MTITTKMLKGMEEERLALASAVEATVMENLKFLRRIRELSDMIAREEAARLVDGMALVSKGINKTLLEKVAVRLRKGKGDGEGS